ncbi:hypothetical protein ACLKA7_006762 [Drosophila subpalustris]
MATFSTNSNSSNNTTNWQLATGNIMIILTAHCHCSQLHILSQDGTLGRPNIASYCSNFTSSAPPSSEDHCYDPIS